MQKLSACLVAASLALVPTSALAGPDRADRHDPWGHVEKFEWSMSQGRLGVMVMSMTPELRTYFGAPSERGVLVAKVEPGSAAARAGVKVGDVILTVRGEHVDDAGDVISALAGAKQGDKISVQLVRDKKTQTVEATMDTTSTSSLRSYEWLRDVFPWFDFERLQQRSGSST